MDNKIKVGFLGFGWRANGYVKAMKELPQMFEIAGIYMRNPKKAEKTQMQYPGLVDSDLEAFLKRKMDFVFLALPREHVVEYLEVLAKKQIPVLCETPPGKDVEELKKVWEIYQKYDAKIQVAEQYFLQPYHSACVHMIESGMLGEVSNVRINMIHDYHGISMMRKYLQTGFMGCKVRAEKFSFPVSYHCGREGLSKDAGKVIMDNRKVATFVFENGKTAFFDFADEQYFNYYRSRHLNIQGVTGEIDDFRVAYKGEDGYPVTGTIERDDLGHYSNLEGYSLRSLTVNGKSVYKSPFAKYPEARLTDDEIAVCHLLIKMKEYVDGKGDAYALEEALWDTYLYFMMDESIRLGKEVEVKN